MIMAKKTDTGITDKGSTKTVPKIEMRDVVKSFGSKHVLKGIDLVVNAVVLAIGTWSSLRRDGEVAVLHGVVIGTLRMPR